MFVSIVCHPFYGVSIYKNAGSNDLSNVEYSKDSGNSRISRGLSSLVIPLGQRLSHESIPLPPVDLVHHHLAHQLVSSQLGEDHGPDQPVHAAGEDDGDARHAVRPIGQGLVDALAVRGRHEGGQDEVDVAQQEEDHHRQGRADGRVPVPRLAVEVEVHQSAGDEDIDNRQRIRD